MYPIGYVDRRVMDGADMLARARSDAGLDQEELAQRSGTSRPTLSAYEHGRRSPTLRTAERILGAAGYELVAIPRITFTERATTRGRPVVVPSRMPRLDPDRALATVTLPVHLDWSGQNRSFHLRDRSQRARVYEVILREGSADDLLGYVDGVLLVEIWDELVLPRDVRAAWEGLISSSAAAA